MAWVLDLDGVVWLAGRAIPGAPEAIDRLRAAGETVAFLTNNSGPTLAQYVEMLASAGIAASAADLVTSSQAAASLLAPRTTASVVGDDGIREALEARGVRVVDLDAGPAAVVVGRATVLDYEQLGAAATVIRGGARFVATNTDATFPTPAGLLPGAGALVAFLSVASGTEPDIAGKPHGAIAGLVRDRFGLPTVVVGDRLDTDGRFATEVGAPFALVLTGVTQPEDLPADPAPDLVAADLAEVVDRLLASGPLPAGGLR